MIHIDHEKDIFIIAGSEIDVISDITYVLLHVMESLHAVGMEREKIVHALDAIKKTVLEVLDNPEKYSTEKEKMM